MVDAMVRDASFDTSLPDSTVNDSPVEVVVNDAASEPSDAATFPCSDLLCHAGEICVHQGFMDDGGFTECDRACLPAPAASPVTCETSGRDYCRLACFDVIDGAIYCLCD